MEFRKLFAFACVVLAFMMSFTSCLLLEEAMTTPPTETSQTEISQHGKDTSTGGPSVDWLLTAQGLDASPGERVTLQLPPGGSAAPVWGTGIYTDDSSIGTAAVHMQLISFATGGEVTIEIRDGLASYEGSTSNGVVSNSYGEWGGSFVFLDRNGQELAAKVSAPAVVAVPATTVPNTSEEIDWSTSAGDLSLDVGNRITVQLSPGGSAGTVWGTGIYTDDSSIGTAAVHMGLITFVQGGTVEIEVQGGQSTFAGSSQNGVVTNSYGDWGGSFVFVDKSGHIIEARQTESHVIAVSDVDWGTSASQWDHPVGSRLTMVLPPDGNAGSLWGTDIYTDDSSIGTAAVHAGLINFASGGRVTIEIRDGQPSYAGSRRNGVESSAYGQWGRSFVFIR